jgi:hypothetical protein
MKPILVIYVRFHDENEFNHIRDTLEKSGLGNDYYY